MASDTLLDALASRAAPAIGMQAARWARLLADGLQAELVPKVPAALQGALLAAIQSIRDNEATVDATTQHGFLAIVSHLAAGNEDRARIAWLATAADFRSEMDALDQAYAATRADVKARAEAWATVRRVAVDLVEAGGKALVPVLLGLVPGL